MINKYTLFIQDDNTLHWHELDIDNIDFSTFYSIQELTDITLKNDTYTKNIVLPATKKNNLALGRLYDISRFSDNSNIQNVGFNFKANKYINCQLFENNIQLIQGKLLIKKIPIKNGIITYEGAILGNVFSFFSDINDRELTDLNSLDDIVEWSPASIQDSWYTTYSTQKYVFPLIDYGIDERKGDYNTWDNSVDIKNFKPAPRLRHVLNAIFRGWRFDEVTNTYTQFDDANNKLNKYSFKSSFFEDENFKRIIVPSTDAYLAKKIIGKKVVFNFPNQNVDRYSIIKGVFSTSNIDDSNYYSNPFAPDFEYLNITYDGGGLSKRTGENYTRTILPLDKHIKTSVRIKLNVSVPSNLVGTWHIGLCDIKANLNIDESNMKWSTTITKTNVTANAQIFNVDYKINEAVELDGQYILAYSREDKGDNSIGDTYNYLRFTNVSVEFGSENLVSEYPIKIFDTFRLHEALPKNVKIKDFLKSVMLMFNLYMIQNPENPNAFIIEDYNYFNYFFSKNDFSHSVDWSSKIDNNNFTLTTNIDLAKGYNYKFTDDDDMVNEYYKNRYDVGYGNREVINSNGLKDAKDIEIIFAPSINVVHSLNDKSQPFICKSESFFEGNKEPYSSKIRLLYYNGRKSSRSYPIHYRGNEIQTLNSYGHCSMVKLDSNNIIVDSLFFGVPKEYFTQEVLITNELSLVDKHHYNQLKELINPNLMIMEADIYLSENDISMLDFRVPIFIETQFGSAYWKLLELEYRNNTTTSKVKLQKIV